MMPESVFFAFIASKLQITALNDMTIFFLCRRRQSGPNLLGQLVSTSYACSHIAQIPLKDAEHIPPKRPAIYRQLNKEVI
jgi:hypothetical protein